MLRQVSTIDWRTANSLWAGMIFPLQPWVALALCGIRSLTALPYAKDRKKRSLAPFSNFRFFKALAKIPVAPTVIFHDRWHHQASAREPPGSPPGSRRFSQAEGGSGRQTAAADQISDGKPGISVGASEGNSNGSAPGMSSGVSGGRPGGSGVGASPGVAG